VENGSELIRKITQVFEATVIFSVIKGINIANILERKGY